MVTLFGVYNMEVIMRVLAIILMISLERCFGLYFHMGETEKKCFLEEIPDETMVTGKSHCVLNMGLNPLRWVV